MENIETTEKMVSSFYFSRKISICVGVAAPQKTWTSLRTKSPCRLGTFSQRIDRPFRSTNDGPLTQLPDGSSEREPRAELQEHSEEDGDETSCRRDLAPVAINKEPMGLHTTRAHKIIVADKVVLSNPIPVNTDFQRVAHKPSHYVNSMLVLPIHLRPRCFIPTSCPRVADVGEKPPTVASIRLCATNIPVAPLRLGGKLNIRKGIVNGHDIEFPALTPATVKRHRYVHMYTNENN